MKKFNPVLPAVQYEDRAAQMTREAIAAEFIALSKEYEKAKEATEDMRKDTIRAANTCRAVGIRLQALCQHEQISFEFWQRHKCGDHLPFDFNAAKGFIALARKLPRIVKTIEEAAPFAQMVFQTTGLLEMPTRDEQQRAQQFSVFQKFLAQVTVVMQPLRKLLREVPMEDWKPAQLDSFLSETEPLNIERERAMKLRGEEYRKP